MFSTWRLVRWKSPESSVALCVCAQLFSCVQLFATPWTVARKAPLSIYQARILNRVAISLFRGSSWPRGQSPISHIGGWILYHWATWGSLRAFRTRLLGLAGPLFLLFSGFVCTASDQGSASLKPCGASCPPESSLDRAPRIEIYADSVKGLSGPFSEHFPRNESISYRKKWFCCSDSLETASCQNSVHVAM